MNIGALCHILFKYHRKADKNSSFATVRRVVHVQKNTRLANDKIRIYRSYY